jgi:hypothetical protein
MRKLSLISILATLVFSSMAVAQATATGTTSITVTIGAEATISITNGSTPLTESGTSFSTFTGTTNLTYQVRTSQTSGSGSVTLKVTSDFSPANGPSVGSPPSAGDTLTYTCTASGGSGPTACSSSQTASIANSTSVLTVGADKHSTSPGSDSGTVSWTLVNDPKYKTGTYTSTVTFTISAT